MQVPADGPEALDPFEARDTSGCEPLHGWITSLQKSF